jgi:hypothetical protein
MDTSSVRIGEYPDCFNDNDDMLFEILLILGFCGIGTPLTRLNIRDLGDFKIDAFDVS